MKRNTWPVNLKKHLLLLLHGLFLTLFLTGVSFIYFNENYGRGLSWLHEESYSDNRSFTEQLESDVEMIFKYVKYKDLFEVDGTLDYDKDMVCVTFSSGKTMIYTLNDMIRSAKNWGYYLRWPAGRRFTSGKPRIPPSLLLSGRPMTPTRPPIIRSQGMPMPPEKSWPLKC